MPKAKTTLKPKLRFPEFKEDNGWELKPIGELFKNRKETGFNDLPLLSLMDKEGIVPQEESNRKNNSNENKDRYLRVVPDDIAYNSMRMWEGRCALVGMEGLVSPAYTICIPQEGIHSAMFGYYFKTPQLIEKFRRYSQGLVKDTLNLKYPAFSKIRIHSTGYLEQKKIADCLTSLDELIAAHRRKLQALKDHKKGLMQQLFPQQGESTPRLRFPEFSNNGKEWKREKAGMIFGNRRDKGVSGIPLYSVTMNDGLVERSSLDRKVDDIAEASGNKRVREGDIVYNTMRMWQGASGVAPCECLVSPAYVVLYPKVKINSAFFGILFKLAHMKETLTAYSRGLTKDRLRLYYDDFASIPLIIPSLAEQKAIANCITSLDASITTVASKIESLSAHKSSLMQQLFPSTTTSHP